MPLRKARLKSVIRMSGLCQVRETERVSVLGFFSRVSVDVWHSLAFKIVVQRVRIVGAQVSRGFPVVLEIRDLYGWIETE